MDAATARWLISDAAAPALEAAASQHDPSSLAAATALRALVAPEQAAAVTEQIVLRRRAVAKAGELAAHLFWTPTGLEQATRRSVAERRARMFAERGAASVVDLTCGLGLDALACARSGLPTTGVELDEVTAIFATANARTTPGLRIIAGDAVAHAPSLLSGGAAAFIDPARRNERGRSWRVEDFAPSWSFVLDVLDGARLAAAKLGPGLPYTLIPVHAEAEWISDRGTVVEATLWAGPGTRAGRRRALVDGHELVGWSCDADAPVGAVGEYLIEPDGAVLRAGLVGVLAAELDACRVHEGIGYLTANQPVATPFATSFRIVEALAYNEKTLRAWVRERRVGVLDIKKRGIDVDPALLRKRLKPAGPNAATLILSPTASGTTAFVVERLPAIA